MGVCYRGIFAALILTMPGAGAFAQQAAPLGDEWIVSGQKYLRIPVMQPGIYRLSKADLDAAGMPAGTTGAAFRMHYLGIEVPLRVSTTGAFTSSDFVEFAGKPCNGKADAELYGTARQTDPNRSLFSDTAAYFLTWGTSPGLRYTDATTAIPATPASTATWCWATSRQSFSGFFAQGLSNTGGYRFPSSQFEEGEGFIHAGASPGTGFSTALPTPAYSTAAGIGAELTTGVVGYSLELTQTNGSYFPPNPHPLKVTVAGQLLVDTVYGAQECRHFVRTLSPAMLGSNTLVQYQTTNSGGPNFDYWGTSYVQLRYPRTLDFTGSSTAQFILEPSATPQAVTLTGLASAGTAPTLYDITNNSYYSADVSVPGQSRFYLAPSAQSRDIIVVTSTAVIPAVVNRQIQFPGWSAGGDFVIITSRKLAGSSVDAYKKYRQSAQGGSHTVTVAYAEDLVDQFGWGITENPLAIRRFLRRLTASGAIKPQHALLLGHGLNYIYTRNNGNAAVVKARALVPTWGHPGSDADFAAFGPNGAPMLSVGRLSVLDATEISTYLAKVEAFEAEQLPKAMPTAATELWKKAVLHIAGAREVILQQDWLLPTLNMGAAIISDTAVGAMVTTVAKNSTNPIDPVTNEYVDSLLNRGNGIVTFHGHAYSGGFDYNINTPEQYTNRPRLPLFLGLGCDVAQIFDTTSGRTISERYVLTPNGGSIAMVAADNIQFTNFHRFYLPTYYSMVGGNRYSATMGQQMVATNDSIMRSTGGNGFFRTNLESLLFQGDPALHFAAPPRPDYHIGSDGLSTTPSVVTIANDSFKLRIVAYNLGRAVRDSAVVVSVSHKAADGTVSEIYRYGIPALLSTDTVSIWVPVNKTKDLGLNQYTVSIDPDRRVAEMSELNNSSTIELFIYGNNLVPLYPKEFGIVGTQNVTLKASTLNPFAGLARYRMELDTTDAFNSPLKQNFTTTGLGGIVRWTPAIQMHDSTVYYWRTAYDSAQNGDYLWGTSSFIYLGGSGPGWNQSHGGQYIKDSYSDLEYDAPGNLLRFGRTDLRIACRVKVMTTAPDAVENNKVQVNEVDYQRSGCSFVNNTTIQIMVLDSATGAIWKNTPAAAAQNGSISPCGVNRGTWAFEFSVSNAAGRNSARRFLDSIPTGHYILAKNCIYAPFYSAAPVNMWKADTTANGSGISLYHTLKNLGFAGLDSFNGMKPFLFWCQKGIASTPVFNEVGSSDTSLIVQSFKLRPFGNSGKITSTIVGPAKNWNSAKWRAIANDGKPQNDSAYLNLYGVRSNTTDTLLLTTAAGDVDLSGISGIEFPRLRLEWIAKDSITRTPPQLSYWRVLHTPVPEIGLNPAAHYAFEDSLQSGQTTVFSVALENMSDEPMDSVLVRFRVADASGGVKPLTDVRYRPLPARDTLHASILFDGTPFAGDNYLFVEANPGDDHPEQYHPNNLGYVPFRVQSDVLNPLLQVTFDDVVIRNRDIVSAKPVIRVKLTDDSRFRTLDDTALISMYVRYPNDPLSSRGRRISFDGTICKFIPATKGAKQNEAVIEYRPLFTERSNTDDRTFYDLSVNARDRSGNAAANLDYKVSFEIVWEPTITNVMAFPNPFSTSTSFGFTITGDHVPETFDIDITDLSGRRVRHLSKADLGNIHVGKNETSFRWDGRDDAGVPLPSGVYLYRASWSNNANVLRHAPSFIDDAFRGGWGRLVIVR